IRSGHDHRRGAGGGEAKAPVVAGSRRAVGVEETLARAGVFRAATRGAGSRSWGGLPGWARGGVGSCRGARGGRRSPGLVSRLGGIFSGDGAAAHVTIIDGPARNLVASPLREPNYEREEPVQRDEIWVGEMADEPTDLGSPDCRDLVDHDLRRQA